MPGACKELQLEFASSHVSHSTRASQAQTCLPLLGARRKNRSKESWADQGMVQTWVLTPTLDVSQVHCAQHRLFQLHEWWQSTATDILCCNSIFPWGAKHSPSIFASLLQTRKSVKKEVIITFCHIYSKLGTKEPTKSNTSDSWVCAIATKPCLTLLHMQSRIPMVHYSFHCTQ